MILINSHYSAVTQHSSEHCRHYVHETSNIAFHGHFFFLIIDQCFAGHQLAHIRYVHTQWLCKCALCLYSSLAMQIYTPWAAHLEQWQLVGLDHLPISHCSSTTGMVESQKRVYGLAHQWGWQKKKKKKNCWQSSSPIHKPWLFSHHPHGFNISIFTHHRQSV